jgi:hypothetical protein
VQPWLSTRLQTQQEIMETHKLRQCSATCSPGLAPACNIQAQGIRQCWATSDTTRCQHWCNNTRVVQPRPRTSLQQVDTAKMWHTIYTHEQRNTGIVQPQLGTRLQQE